MRRRSGFSLIELVIASSLVSLVLFISVELLGFSGKVAKSAMDEFTLQSSTRIAAQTAISKNRNATAVFAIPKSRFSPSNLSVGWNYIGIEDTTINGKPSSSIMLYEWDNTTNARKTAKVLVEAVAGITYAFEFSKSYVVNSGGSLESNKLLDIHIVGYLDGDTSTPHITLDGSAFGFNSLQVLDYGTDLDQAAAISFREEERPGSYVAHIAMILDKSGSMLQDMDGHATSVIEEQRITILKTAAKNLLTELKSYDNIDISIIPFAFQANDAYPFMKASDDYNLLVDAVDSISPNGATNTGDAIRRAYYLLKSHNAEVAAGFVKNYLIVLVDGDTTICSIEQLDSLADFNPASPKYYLKDNAGISNPTAFLLQSLPNFENYINGYHNAVVGGSYPVQLVGEGGNITTLTKEYVRRASLLFTSPTQFARPFVIGLSNSVSTEGLSSVYTSLNITDPEPPNVFRANDSAALSAAFNSIADEITAELWHLNGPTL